MASAGSRVRATRKAIERFEHPPVEYDPKALDDPRIVKRVRLACLEIATNVQRGIRSERVDQLRNEWDWRLAELPTVVDLGDDRYRVVEGQHRILAALKRCPTGSIWVVVLPRADVGTATEADLGYRISTGRRGHDAYERWMMRLARGDEHEVLASAVLDDLDLRIGRTSSASTIAGVAAVSAIVHGRRASPEAGAELLRDVLTVVVTAWPIHDYESRISRFDYRLLAALAEIIRRNGERVDLGRLASRLTSLQAARWIRDALDRKEVSVTQAIAEGVIGAYNRRLSSSGRLSW